MQILIRSWSISIKPERNQSDKIMTRHDYLFLSAPVVGVLSPGLRTSGDDNRPEKPQYWIWHEQVEMGSAATEDTNYLNVLCWKNHTGGLILNFCNKQGWTKNLPLYGTAAVAGFSVFGLLVPAPESQASWNTLLAECPRQAIPAASSLQIQFH